MSDNRPNIQERYITSANASNLMNDSRHHKTDILAAMALVGGLGSILLRLKSGLDVYVYPQAMENWKTHVTELADKRHWPTHVQPRIVAHKTLTYWLGNICHECEGRKYVRHEKSPTLKAECCPVCDGTGVKPTNFPKDIQRFCVDALGELDEIDFATGVRAARKLG